MDAAAALDVVLAAAGRDEAFVLVTDRWEVNVPAAPATVVHRRVSVGTGALDLELRTPVAVPRARAATLHALQAAVVGGAIRPARDPIGRRLADLGAQAAAAGLAVRVERDRDRRVLALALPTGAVVGELGRGPTWAAAISAAEPRIVRAIENARRWVLD